MTRTITKAIYLLFAAISILFGATSLISPTTLHSNATESFHFRHNLRELGAASVFIGVMALWCNLNYDRSKTVHYLLTFFNLLIAAIHWYDYSRGDLPLTSPLFNSLGFVVFMAIALARYNERGN